tara:strand:+ start:11192 stop:11395 length:204 start_codon:yes stop_codon:yes gene_type:complete
MKRLPPATGASASEADTPASPAATDSSAVDSNAPRTPIVSTNSEGVERPRSGGSFVRINGKLERKDA